MRCKACSLRHNATLAWDPVQAARELREQDIIVHLIGFGLGNAADEDAASLQAIADASGGRYVTAGSAEELKEALALTVGTSFRVFNGSTEVANGSLGSDEPLFLPGGDYTVELDSLPPQVVHISLAPRDRLTLTLEKEGDHVSHFERRNRLQYTSCDDTAESIERLGGSKEMQEPIPTTTY